LGSCRGALRGEALRGGLELRPARRGHEEYGIEQRRGCGSVRNVVTPADVTCDGAEGPVRGQRALGRRAQCLPGVVSRLLSGGEKRGSGLRPLGADWRPLGDGRKDGPSPEEAEEMYPLGRRSLIATRDLAAGTVLVPDMITTKRPGFGIAPKQLSLVLGRPLKIDVEEDEILTWDMV
jgi:hypothetical protein